MKFTQISESDVEIIRKARRILKKLQKKYNELSRLEKKACTTTSMDYRAIALKNWNLLGEFEHLKIDVNADDTLSINS